MCKEEKPCAEQLGIDIIIPTRARVDKLWRVMTSIRDTSTNPEKVCVVVCIDEDDEATKAEVPKFKKWVCDEDTIQLVFLEAKQSRLAEIYNRARCCSGGDILMYAADDLEFMTNGWDQVVRNFFFNSGDRIWLLWCHDPAREEPFPDHGFVSRWSVNALRYLFPVFGPKPGIEDAKGIAFTDIWLDHLYGILGRKVYMKDVEIAHRHWHGENVELDDSYVATNILSTCQVSPEFTARVEEIPQHAERLKKFIRWYRRKAEEVSAAKASQQAGKGNDNHGDESGNSQ